MKGLGSLGELWTPAMRIMEREFLSQPAKVTLSATSPEIKRARRSHGPAVTVCVFFGPLLPRENSRCAPEKGVYLYDAVVLNCTYMI